MIKTIAQKELINNVLSLRFSLSFILSSMLMIVSIYILIDAYTRQVKALSPLLEADGYRRAAEGHRDFARLAGGPTPVSRSIPLLKVLCTGVGNELSLRATVRGYEGPIYKREAFISNPAPILFPNVDFGFIVNVVVSIIAMLFTYDIIAGEKQAGTLSLLMANDIPRGQLLLGKWLGSYSSFLLGYVPCLLIAAIVLQVHPMIEMRAQDWQAVGALFLISLVYASAFFSLGLFISCLTTEPRAALLTLLAIWVAFVLIIPNFSPYLAEQIHPTPPPYKVEAQMNTIRYEAAKNSWNRILNFLKPRGLENTSTGNWQGLHQGTWADGLRRMMGNLPDDAIRDELDKFSAQVTMDELRYVDFETLKIKRDYTNALERQMRTGVVISCLSPSAVFTYLASDLTQTGIQSENRFRNAAERFKMQYVDYIVQKIGSSDRLLAKPDVADLPLFPYNEPSIAEIINDDTPYLLLLLLYNLVFFMGAYISFLRYDVR